MAISEPFSDIEHLQLVVRRIKIEISEKALEILHNDAAGYEWEPQGTTRGAGMLRALLHEDSDPPCNNSMDDVVLLHP